MGTTVTRTPYRHYPEYEWSGPDDVDDDLDVGALFRDDLQRNPEICSNCWTHIRDVVFPHDSASGDRGENTETWKGLVRYYVSKPDRTESARIPGQSPTRNPPRSCSNCGSIRGTTFRPLSRTRAVEYAWNLSATLRRFDVEHNPVVLALTVAHRKRFPEFASRDDDNFRLAVEYAVEFHARDVLVPGPTDPARVVQDDHGNEIVEPRIDRPALPAPGPDARPRAFHGRPSLHAHRNNDSST